LVLIFFLPARPRARSIAAARRRMAGH